MDATGKPDARYAVGIDLGTTNTAVGYVDLARSDGSSDHTIEFFDIPQLVGPGEFAREPVLPSLLYLPGPHELPEGSTSLPWAPDRSYAVGVLAREQGARVPGRLVSSAKSWLTHDRVDRTGAILPWGAPDGVEQVSPVEATTRYLQHIREAWNSESDKADHRLEDQLIILTVPASFDEDARELTVEAAIRAGLPGVVLLEEPLAAFYHWLDHHETEMDVMEDDQLILVCDVGGGTTDFSIMGVQTDDGGELRFERLAVGKHLMLGGDNMDFAIGRRLEADLTGSPHTLEVKRWNQLVHQCRTAKEQLLSEGGDTDAVEIAVAGSGSSLIGDTLRGRISRNDVEELVLNGFFPDTSPDAEPVAEQRGGLTELGLPYEQDPAITRHLAAFWRSSLAYLTSQTARPDIYPDYILFNGGVFAPKILRQRVKEIVGNWFQPVAGEKWTPAELRNPRLDRAVAAGAAYYGLVRIGQGIRVGSGSPRTYYAALDTNADGSDAEPHLATCLVPRGAPEGFEAHIRETTFEARANQPVTFQLFSSSTRSGDMPGQVVELDRGEISALPPIRTVLKFGKRVARTVPVQLAAHLTEVGTLQLWCESVHTEHRWNLQFDVRQEPPEEEDLGREAGTIEPSQIRAACDRIDQMFEDASTTQPPDALWNDLEQIVDQPRENWPVPLLRKLADTLLNTSRDRSPEHEATWFDLLGYCLRPGYGDSVDEWRMEQAWILHLEKLNFPGEEENRLAWWLFWRRVGGGLPLNKQEQLYYEARPFIQPKVRTRKEHAIYSRRMNMSEKQEAWMSLATFERLSPDIKIALGKLLTDKFKKSRPRSGELWALSRLGTRHPLYGPLDALVPPRKVEFWLDTLLNLHLRRTPSAAYALVHMARKSGDRGRDVSPEAQKRVHRWLRKMDDPEAYRELLADPEGAPDHEGQDWFVSEPLPRHAPAAILDPHGITYASADEDGS